MRMTSDSPAAPGQADPEVMALLLEANFPVSIKELEQAIGNALDARDAISRIERVGLIHRLDSEFVMPTQAARAAAELLDQ